MDDLSAAALSDLWTAVHEALRTALTRQQFETWFRGMRLRAVDEARATFAVPNDFTREWVETYYRDLLRSTLLDHTGRALDVDVVVSDDTVAAQRDPAPRAGDGRAADDHGGNGRTEERPDGDDGNLAENRGAPHGGDRAAGRNGAHEHPSSRDVAASRWGAPAEPLGPSGASEALREPRTPRRAPPQRRSHDTSRGQLFGHSRYPYFLSDVLLNDDYVFENFVAGPGNQLAHAAAQAVANAPAQAYNPLFLHGSVGLGKTHLLQAICHRVLARRPDTRILYLSCETFVNQFISAVEAGGLEDFRYRYRQVDMLLIDDIHFLARKERTQDEFFHTFNALYNSKKQVVLSCDSPPREIPTLEDRLVSRFKWGLVTEIEQPDHETRISIVRRKAERRGAELPAGVAELIADNIATNVRELEGAVLKVIGYASLTRRPLTLELAAEALRDVIRPKERKVTLDTIVRAVCEHFGVKPSDLTSKRRQKSISQPRQVCMYLARRLTDASLMEIGGHLGGRDHTTVIYANDRIATELEKSPRMKEDLEAIARRIRAGE